MNKPMLRDLDDDTDTPPRLDGEAGVGAFGRLKVDSEQSGRTTVENLAWSPELVMLESPTSAAADVIREIRMQLVGGPWRQAPARQDGWEPRVALAAPSPAMLLTGPSEAEGSSRALAPVAGATPGAAPAPSAFLRPPLAIVSRRSGDGRSFIAANLAICLAQTGSRVLLVDADLHGPTLHTLLGVAAVPGLAQLLEQAAVPFVSPVPQLPRLAFLPAGSDGASGAHDLLQGDRLGLILQELGRAFDYVILDTPAAERSTDWQSIGMAAGMVALVVRSGVSRVDDSKAMARQIGAIGVRAAGVIVNS